MIDIHCHILPGIDDGARDVEQSLDLLRFAVEQGITHMVATPHIHAGRYENETASIRVVWGQLRQRVQAEGLPIELGMAGEVRIQPEILQSLPRGRIPFLGEVDGYRVMLLEFPHQEIPLGSDKLVRWLLSRKVRPLIAHPERNKMIMADLGHLRSLIELGCLTQVTAASVAGRFGPGAEATAAELLANDWVDVIASDSHNIKNRPPILREGLEAAQRLVGDRAIRLVKDNPWSIVSSQFQQ